MGNAGNHYLISEWIVGHKHANQLSTKAILILSTVSCCRVRRVLQCATLQYESPINASSVSTAAAVKSTLEVFEALIALL